MQGSSNNEKQHLPCCKYPLFNFRTKILYSLKKERLWELTEETSRMKCCSETFWHQFLLHSKIVLYLFYCSYLKWDVSPIQTDLFFLFFPHIIKFQCFFNFFPLSRFCHMVWRQRRNIHSTACFCLWCFYRFSMLLLWVTARF